MTNLMRVLMVASLPLILFAIYQLMRDTFQR